MQEVWKDIDGYEGFYQVSNCGRVRSLSRLSSCGRKLSRRILSDLVDKKGYLVVRLYKNGIGKTFKVHVLVAKAFVPNPNNFVEVNHKDENKQNSRADNLEWCSRKYNMNYGTCQSRKGKANKRPVLMCSLSGDVLKRFDSIQEAQKFVGATTIAHCCKGKAKTVKGYIWKYENSVCE